jgi:hypothetical protein
MRRKVTADTVRHQRKPQPQRPLYRARSVVVNPEMIRVRLRKPGRNSVATSDLDIRVTSIYRDMREHGENVSLFLKKCLVALDDLDMNQESFFSGGVCSAPAYRSDGSSEDDANLIPEHVFDIEKAQQLANMSFL